MSVQQSMSSDVRVQFILPREKLRPYIQLYWSWEGNNAFHLPRLLPEPVAELVLYYGSPFLCRSKTRDYGLVPTIHLVGFRDCYYDIQSSGPIGFLAVRFQPTSPSFFIGRATSEWVNDFASAQELWGGEGNRLEDAFLSASNLQERVRVVEDFLERNLLRHYHGETQWGRTLGALACASNDPECRLKTVAQESGITMRSMQRQFQERMGISPKTYLRLKRFERLVTGCLAQGGNGYMQQGQDLGYYDQSHIIRDFEEFAGTTPSNFFIKEKRYLSLFYNTVP